MSKEAQTCQPISTPQTVPTDRSELSSVGFFSTQNVRDLSGEHHDEKDQKITIVIKYIMDLLALRPKPRTGRSVEEPVGKPRIHNIPRLYYIIYSSYSLYLYLLDGRPKLGRLWKTS